MAEDNSWVFDSLVCFLHGPVWIAPLQTFIEEKSIIFDPNEDKDEKDPEYRKIHEEYKSLVDYMLGSFMEEMHITPEQFEFACLEGRNQNSDNPLNFHQGLFQQIWAANDIKIFIRMMTQRNVELQLQALDLIERTHSFENPEPPEVVEQPKETQPEDLNQDKVEQEIVNVVKRELESPEQHASIEEENKEEKFERLNLFFENKEISPDELKSRQEYLRTQRDKILEIKRKTRVQQLNETTKKGDRPSSAQVAQKILEGNVDDVVSNQDKNPASLQLRKTLAKRLRSEVVEQQ